jgi:hypothetical protein
MAGNRVYRAPRLGIPTLVTNSRDTTQTQRDSYLEPLTSQNDFYHPRPSRFNVVDLAIVIVATTLDTLEKAIMIIKEPWWVDNKT